MHSHARRSRIGVLYGTRLKDSTRLCTGVGKRRVAKRAIGTFLREVGSHICFPSTPDFRYLHLDSVSELGIGVAS